MKSFRTLCLVFVLLALGTIAGAQNTNTNVMEQRQAVGTAVAKPAEPKIPAEDRERATKLLDLSESQARSFEAPLRSYMLYQVAQSYLPLDKAKSRTLYRDAFTSTLDIRDDDDLKQRLQDSILTGLLPVSQADVEERLPQAEIPARKRASIAIAQKYLTAKKFDKAVALVESMTPWTEFPYDIGGQIMSALPEQMNDDFRTLFTMAFSSYQSHPHIKGMLLGGGDFGTMVAKFGTRLPPRITLEAIDEILKQSKEKEAASITVSGDGGVASFTSPYQYELFQLLPLIRKLDPGHAKALLDEQSSVKSLGAQYPNGIQSLNPDPPDAATNPDAKPHGIGYDVRQGEGSGASAEDQMRYAAEQRARQLAQDSETDPIQAIAQAAGLPTMLKNSSPRADALLGIARANLKKNPMAAKQALGEARKALQDVIPRFQVRNLVPIAKAYLEMEDPDSAQKTIDEGFKLSEKLLVIDNNADDPNKALKAWWPSVESYRLFLEIETKISQKDALAKLEEIQDPEMQTIERVMFTNALLGKPMKTSTMVQKNKSGTHMSTSSTD